MKILQDETKETASETTNNSGGGVGKKILLGIIAIIILGAIYVAATEWSKNNRPSSDYTLTEIDKLQEEQQRKIIEDQLKDAQAKVNALTPSSDTSDRYTAYIRLAELQNRLEMYREAIGSVDQIVAENQGTSRVWVVYAVSYIGTGDKDKAKEAALKALALDDEVADHWHVYFAAFNDLSAEELNAKYVEALQKTDNELALVISYARFLESTGNIARAVAYWETARNIDPEHAADYEREINRLRPPE